MAFSHLTWAEKKEKKKRGKKRRERMQVKIAFLIVQKKHHSTGETPFTRVLTQS